VLRPLLERCALPSGAPARGRPTKRDTLEPGLVRRGAPVAKGQGQGHLPDAGLSLQQASQRRLTGADVPRPLSPRAQRRALATAGPVPKRPTDSLGAAFARSGSDSVTEALCAEQFTLLDGVGGEPRPGRSLPSTPPAGEHPCERSRGALAPSECRRLGKTSLSLQLTLLRCVGGEPRPGRSLPSEPPAPESARERSSAAQALAERRRLIVALPETLLALPCGVSG
jgi:hypothetical protein